MNGFLRYCAVALACVLLTALPALATPDGIVAVEGIARDVGKRWRAEAARPTSHGRRPGLTAAAHGTGPPPKVLPRSPTLMLLVTSAVATTAPMGSPAASPLAKVRISGVTPYASAALKAPQRPTPH